MATLIFYQRILYSRGWSCVSQHFRHINRPFFHARGLALREAHLRRNPAFCAVAFTLPSRGRSDTTKPSHGFGANLAIAIVRTALTRQSLRSRPIRPHGFGANLAIAIVRTALTRQSLRSCPLVCTALART